MAYTLPSWANSPATTSPISAANLTQFNTAINDLDTRATYRGTFANPNSNVTGSPGDVYCNTTGGSGTTLWVKESGSATNTGWVVSTPLSLGGQQCVQPFLMEDTPFISAPSSTNFYGTAFVASRSITVSTFIVNIDTAQAGGTLFRLGLYTVASNEAWTLVARSSGAISDANSATVSSISFNTTGGYPATYAITAGSTYGVGVCQVGATTAPILRKKDIGNQPALGTPIYAFRRCVFVGGASECPTSVASSQQWGNQMFWIALT